MKRKTTEKLTKAEREELEKQLELWIQSKGRPVTKAEKKCQWQNMVNAKVKSAAEKRRQRRAQRSELEALKRREAAVKAKVTRERRKKLAEKFSQYRKGERA